MRKKFVAGLLVSSLLVSAFGTTASACIPIDGGYVVAEYGDSYGSIAAEFGLNYITLMMSNNYMPIDPGDLIYIEGCDWYDTTDYPYNTVPEYIEYGSYVEPVSYDEPVAYTESVTYEEPVSYEEQATYTDTISYEESVSYEDSSIYEEPVTYTEPVTVTEPVAKAGSRTSKTSSKSSESANKSSESGKTLGSTQIYSSYTNNGYYNVNHAASLNNGVTIAAHSDYNAFSVLGDGGYSMGFKEAPGLMSDGSTPLLVGSGICFVETAVYQAGRDAGLTIKTANNHSGNACAYAAAGDQAMFNYPTSNLIMTNPYDYPITLQVIYDGLTLSASFIAN